MGEPWDMVDRRVGGSLEVVSLERAGPRMLLRC
jgi:hypothetical protein